MMKSAVNEESQQEPAVLKGAAVATYSLKRESGAVSISPLYHSTVMEHLLCHSPITTRKVSEKHNTATSILRIQGI